MSDIKKKAADDNLLNMIVQKTKALVATCADAIPKLLIVTVDGEKPSHTFQEICDHVQNGGNVVLQYDGIHIPLTYITDGGVVFECTKEDLSHDHYEILNDGLFYTTPTYFTTADDVQTMIDDTIDASVVGHYRVTDHGISTDAEDNTTALQALIDEVSAKGGGTIFFPVGTYNFMRRNSSDYRWAIEMKSNVSIVGENMEKTVLKQTQDIPYSLFGRILNDGEGATNPLTGCVFKNFTVDAYDTGDTNHVCGKAFFFQYVKDCVFRDLILRGTVATALGIDFLDRVVIDNVSCIDCGRTFTGNEAGTSGIGIGTAGWENENFIITNCICVGSGQYGIFIENQGIFYDGNVPYAKGSIISNCIVRNGINKGIGIRGGQNVTVIGCESYENTSHGIFIDNDCKNVKVISCSSANNGGSGILITPDSTEHLVVKGCTFVNNQSEGIKVSVDAGKNANKLCIQDCYTDGNMIGMDLSASYLEDCVILGNTTLDGINNNATFTGNTAFNSLINAADPDTPSEPTVKNIIVPYNSMSDGKKLMPDGSFTEGQVGQTLATEAYIDVSALSDAFILRYPAAANGPIRVAQYDSSKASLSTSFGLDGPTETTSEYDIWQITKLEGCHYIRIFLSGGGFTNMDGELCSMGGGEDLAERLDALEDRLAALEAIPIYNGEVEDV